MRKVLGAVAVLVGGIAVAVTAFALLMTSYRNVILPADSMNPTMGAGDKLRLRSVDGARRGDVVVFRADTWGGRYPGKELVARVVGIGGDTVVCCDPQGRLSVNRKPVVEEYLLNDEPVRDPKKAWYTTTVQPGNVFVLGDSRANAIDSRDFLDRPGHLGSIPEADITGVAVALNNEPLVPTRAFTDAGLAGAPYEDGWSYRGFSLMAAAGGVIFLGGVVLLLWPYIARARKAKKV